MIILPVQNSNCATKGDRDEGKMEQKPYLEASVVGLHLEAESSSLP